MKRIEVADKMYDHLKEMWDGDIQSYEHSKIYDWLTGKQIMWVSSDDDIHTLCLQYELEMT